MGTWNCARDGNVRDIGCERRMAALLYAPGELKLAYECYRPRTKLIINKKNMCIQYITCVCCVIYFDVLFQSCRLQVNKTSLLLRF